MKKSLLIIVLCLLQGACASQPEAVSSAGTLLSYADLATEITVGFEDLADGKPSSQSDAESVDTP